MGELLQPVNYTLDLVNNITSKIMVALNSVRGIVDKIRNFMMQFIEKIMAIFLNLLIGVQETTMNLKDLFGKFMGTIVAFMLFSSQFWSMV